MKKDTWGRNIIYFILIVTLFYIRVVLGPTKLINLLCIGGIGFILGLDYNDIQSKKEKKLKINVSKLIILGLPSLVLAGPNIVSEFTSSMSLIESINIVSSIIYGHTLASSIFKSDSRNVNSSNKIKE